MIRKLVVDDLDEIYNICSQQFKEESWTKLQLQDALESNFCLGFFEGEKLASFLIAQNLIDDFNILLIATAENFKRQHLASDLLQNLEKHCIAMNISKIWLEVRQSNISAQKFYLKNNFKQICIRKKYYGGKEDAIILEKHI